MASPARVEDSIMMPPPRSAGSRLSRRAPQPWPRDKPFRILSIDGGGIRGIFPATVLAAIEERYLGGKSVVEYFDLVAGASTGGILALGLGADLTAQTLRDLYVDRGYEVFPPLGQSLAGRWRRYYRAARRCLLYSYDQASLANLLGEQFHGRAFGSSIARLCIPSFDGVHGEVYIFKTPHHPDFSLDRGESMVKVALATSAAPTYFRPLDHGGYRFVDGGVWANNPVMIAVTEALTSFELRREQIQVLSLGCGDDLYNVHGLKWRWGGLWFWRDIIFAAMRLQSQNALGQAGLLIGPENLVRINVGTDVPKIALDDWERARKHLPSAAMSALEPEAGRIAATFLRERVQPWVP